MHFCTVTNTKNICEFCLIISHSQSTKILLVHLKCKIIFCVHCDFFHYCDRNLNFIIALSKVIALNILFFLFDISSLLRLLITLSTVIFLIIFYNTGKFYQYQFESWVHCYCFNSC